MGSVSPDSRLLPIIMLVTIIALAFIVYLPGLNGGFIFDDAPNLELLSNYGGVVDYETFKSFVFHGISSPLGRPVSLASFLLDSNTWPADAYSFKTTNLKIHILVGLLVCWTTLNLMRLLGRSEHEAIWIALINAAVWMFHPLMVSTTLYVVQRMAQLSALFVITGINGYLYGRIIQLRGALVSGYIWMSLSLVVATTLAVLSKENGILLPLLILVIEFCLSKKTPSLLLWWKSVFLFAPSLVVIWILIREINFDKLAWPTRLFTQPERLLTEPRVIWEYLYYLWVPHVEGRGLFQDGYNFSRSILSPITTLTSLVGLVALVCGAVLGRLKYPLVSLAILFFLVGHLLESTTIGLELYFEHRNYLPAIFMFLPVVALIVDLRKRISLLVSIITVFVILSFLSLFTWQRASLWSNTEALQYYWAASTPLSARAQAKIVNRMMSLGRTDEAIGYMENAIQKIPQSSLLTVSLLIIKVHAYKATDDDFDRALKRLDTQIFDPQSIMGLRNLVEDVVTTDRLGRYGKNCMDLLSILEKNVRANRISTFRRIVPYLKASLYMAYKQYDMAFVEYQKAIPLHRDVDASLAMVAEMANAGRPVEALKLLDVAYDQYGRQNDSTLIRSREDYDFEFERLRKGLNSDIQALELSRGQ